MPTPPQDDVPLRPDELRALHRVVSRLERLLDVSARFVRSSVEPPVPDSPMARAYDREVSDPYHMSELLILSAEDHLRAIVQVTKAGRLPYFALYTLLRAAGEADTRCRYLLDPGLTETERLARALNERLDNLIEQNKIDLGGKPDYEERVRHLEQRAVDNGITPRREKGTGASGPITAFGEPRRSQVQLFGDYFSVGSIAYRFLCGFSHSRPSVQFRREMIAASSQPGMLEASLQLNVVLFAKLLMTVLDLHDENIGHWFTLAGYPRQVWIEAKKKPAG